MRTEHKIRSERDYPPTDVVQSSYEHVPGKGRRLVVRVLKSVPVDEQGEMADTTITGKGASLPTESASTPGLGNRPHL